MFQFAKALPTRSELQPSARVDKYANVFQAHLQCGRWLPPSEREACFERIPSAQQAARGTEAQASCALQMRHLIRGMVS